MKIVFNLIENKKVNHTNSNIKTMEDAINELGTKLSKPFIALSAPDGCVIICRDKILYIEIYDD